MTNNQNLDISDVVLRRNRLLEKLFKDCNVPVRIIGDAEKPMFVYGEFAFLSVYVKNFELHFKISPDAPQSFAVVKLRARHGLDHDKFMKLLSQSSHNAVIKIRLVDAPLCVIGYNYVDTENNEHRYPVFGRYGHKVYFKKKYVDELVAELNADGYNVRPWVPAFDNQDADLPVILSDKE